MIDVRDLRTDSGSVLALVAVMIPVLLLLTALVVDVGNWFTHDRQLQNRADGAAQAAGVEYAAKWSACVGGDATAKVAAATAIIAAARRYAGDPTARVTPYPYDPAVTPPVNTEIADQSKLDVMINSPSYDLSGEYMDGVPCSDHSGGGVSEWTDVKVKEHDLPSLFGTVGLPLAQTTAQARIEIRPALSINGLIPFAVPERDIRQAQVRYVNECTDTELTVPGGGPARVDLNPLDASYQPTGVTLWGPRGSAPPDVPVSPSPVDINLPTVAGCNGRTVLIGTEVRIASVPQSQLDIDTASCGALLASQFADCFHQLSSIRAWEFAQPNTQPLIGDVTLTSSCGPDAYFSRPPDGSTSCAVGVGVFVDWGDRDDGPLNVPDNFDVIVPGIGRLTPPPGSPTGIWTGSGLPADSSSNGGANDIVVELAWNDTDPTHVAPGGANCAPPVGVNPCMYSGPPTTVHRSFVGSDQNAGIVELVRTSLSQQVGATPGPSFDTVRMQSAPVVQSVYPTLGLRSPLATRTQFTLRTSSPRASQSLDCEQGGGQGTAMFATGCRAFYGKNAFSSGFWWNTATRHCPTRDAIWSAPNSPSAPWQCSMTAPAFADDVIAQGIAIRTGNCPGFDQSAYSCSAPSCIHPNYYDPATGIDDNPGGPDPRIVSVLIVPYQSLKGVTGGNPDETVPVLGYAGFYVTGWASSGSAADPCTSDPDGGGPGRPDEAAAPGEIVGYFIESVEPDLGPVESSQVCAAGQLTPCRAVLVR